LLAELSAAQDAAVGPDGTTSVVVFAGALCSAAAKLLERGAHPLVVARGFRLALDVACEAVVSSAMTIDIEQDSEIAKVLYSCLADHDGKEHIANVCVSAVRAVWNVSAQDAALHNIKLDLQIGGTLAQTRLIRGVHVRRAFAHSSMQRTVRNAKIAVISFALEAPRLKTRHQINIQTPAEHSILMETQKRAYRQALEAILASGANVVVCQWAIDTEVAHMLASSGIAALAWIAGDELERVALAVCASICSRLDMLQADMLGYAGSVTVR